MLGDNLIKLRKKQGMSQQEVADILQVSRQTISNWELNQGAPTIDKATELARLYHISLDDLVGLEVVSTNRKKESLLLKNLIGKVCKLDCKEVDLLLDSPIKEQFLILDINNQWVKVKYERKKMTKKKEEVIKLIDIDDINGFEVVGETNE
ncbi:helix-turn-helix transcriptional regulator [Candidatus Stoquefichus massiliensis]|uniref:helix-turn-helix transcriptional regulator n=1 Tax=Candidatus Stoquefichus massiliensis TaxID=1470350 RepID=UPI000486B9BB|nr:helix-turn-helix transcriptional regulator [Candidatus Stoquefichus massiliensis]